MPPARTRASQSQQILHFPDGLGHATSPHVAEPSPPPRALVWLSIGFYGLMTAIGVVIIEAADLDLGELILGDGTHVARDTLLGAGAGLIVVLLSWWTRDLGPMKKLSAEFREMLGDLSSPVIAVLAVTSAIGEEVLFRGAVQPLLGLWLTSAIFGFVHGGLQKRLLAWTIFATLAGILLGGLFEYTGNLLAPILCHLTVNYWNLHALIASGDE